MRTFLFAIFAMVSSVPSQAQTIEEHCDIGAENLRSFSASTAEECQSACKSEKACAAFTHISGWNRCFLKKAAKPKTTVKMYSGEIAVSADKRSVGEEGYERDHNGKDWRKVIVDTPEECRAACLEKTPCLAFTLIQGYRTCWLKNTKGTLKPKIFRCGQK